MKMMETTLLVVATVVMGSTEAAQTPMDNIAMYINNMDSTITHMVTRLDTRPLTKTGMVSKISLK